MNHTNPSRLSSASLKAKSIFSIFIYSAILGSLNLYLTLNFSGSGILEVFYVISTLLSSILGISFLVVLFGTGKSYDIDFNTRQFISKDSHERIDFDNVKIISLSKSFLPFMGFSLVFTKDFKDKEFNNFASYSNSLYPRFEREFKRRAKQGMEEYMKYSQENTKVGSTGMFADNKKDDEIYLK